MPRLSATNRGHARVRQLAARDWEFASRHFMMPGMGACPEAIQRLIDRFDHQLDQVRSPDYNETQLRIDFVNPMFRELGWDIDNEQGFAEQYREVVHEDRVRVAGVTKAPDYSFRVGGNRKFFLEAKKPSVNLKDAWEPAYQLRRYGWSAKLAVSLLTNFEALAIYDCRVQPKEFDKPSTARREFMTCQQYPEKWEFLATTFSKDAVLRGDFDRYCGSTRGRGAQEFDDAFLEEIEEWRKKLAGNLALRNEAVDERGLNFAVQRIIDRIIFLRICEDRGIEHVGQLRALLNGEQVYSRLFKLFRDADTRYNSGLFHFRPEKDRDESPDELTPGLDVDDATLKAIIRRLYYPESPYEFTVVSADILGSVYERFLGKVITLITGHRAKIEEKPEVRKAGGVYYTPTYIVDYIVQQTVGKLLEGKSPKDAASIKILDPACGSGSFLIGAYQYLLDWHLRWYSEHEPQRWSKGKSATLRPDAAGGRRLTIRERKRILLDNIHGVDIDYQAVEVTKLSLLLKVLEGETAESLGGLWSLFRERALPDLGRNIQCGNSLIGTDIIATDAWKTMSEDEQQRVNPFDYERTFSQVFKPGGFDAVIGNPPYVRMELFVASKPYLEAKYHCHDARTDLYVYFVERSLGLLRPKGRYGVIVSNKWIESRYGERLRAFVRRDAVVEQIIDFGELPVFSGAATFPAIFVMASQAPAGTYGITICDPFTPETLRAMAEGNLQLHDAVSRAGRTTSSTALADACWTFPEPKPRELLDKLRGSGIELTDYVNDRILYGIKTGLVEAFVIDGDTRRRILRESPQAKRVIRPLVIGDDIRRYSVRPADRYLIYIPKGTTVSGLGGVLRHLRPFRERLQARASRQEWYELQQSQEAYSADFPKPKILYPDIAKESRFALDDDGLFPADTAFAIPVRDLALLGILNSQVAWFYFKSVCPVLGDASRGGRLRLKYNYVRRLPLPWPWPADAGQSARLGELVQQMIELSKRRSAAATPHQTEQLQRQIDATNRRIDQLVHELYGLTDEEIRIVEDAAS